MSKEQGEITVLLKDVGTGDTAARERLLKIVYQELRSLAGSLVAGERPGHTLQATAVVHEAYFKLFGENVLQAPNRRYFFAAAARAMRQVLVDHARRRAAAKRPNPKNRVPLDDVLEAFQQTYKLDVLWLARALERLEEFAERQHEVVMLHFFAGFSQREIAEQLGVSVSTVEKDWRAARAWLHSQLAESEA